MFLLLGPRTTGSRAKAPRKTGHLNPENRKTFTITNCCSRMMSLYGENVALGQSSGRSVLSRKKIIGRGEKILMNRKGISRSFLFTGRRLPQTGQEEEFDLTDRNRCHPKSCLRRALLFVDLTVPGLHAIPTRRKQTWFLPPPLLSLPHGYHCGTLCEREAYPCCNVSS